MPSDAHAPTETLHPQIPRAEPTDLADVRETGTPGGFIRGAVNLPRADFDDDDKVDALIDKLKDEPEIVFHCQHSQQRGPGAAYQFLQRLERKLAQGEPKPEVKVLRGGFHEFSQQFGDDDKLVDARPLK